MSDRITFVVPGSLNIRTGGYNYDRKIIEGLKARGRDVGVIELGGNYPAPNKADRDLAQAAFTAIPDGALVVVDGLAFGVLPEIAEKEGKRLRLIALVHHPLAEETGLNDEIRATLAESETRALASARAVIASSAFTRDRLADYGVAPGRIRVVFPGTDKAPLAMGRVGGEMQILCPASYFPRKGHSDLFKALAPLKDLSWRLTCVGEKDLNPTHFAALKTLRNSLGLSGRVDLKDRVADEELNRLYAVSDLVALASLYEGFGMVVTEALMRGLPVVTTTGGALKDTLSLGAGLACAPGDVNALTENLRTVLTDRTAYERLRDGARAARETLPGWEDSAAAFDDALQAVPCL
jgi:glycosyltransferase involved in cell wall biosynthesis